MQLQGVTKVLPNIGEGSRILSAADVAFENLDARLHGPAFTRHHVSEHQLADIVARQRGLLSHCIRLPFHILFAALVFVFFSSHYRRSTAHEFAKAVSDSLSRPSLHGTSFPNSAWAWLSNRCEKPFVVPHSLAIGGARLRWLPEATGHTRDDVQRQAPEDDKVLCDYSKGNFLYDAIRVKLGSDARPRFCQPHHSEAYWVHWPIYCAQALNSNWLTTGGQAGGAKLQVLTKSQRVDFYVIYKAKLSFDASGLSNLEVSSSSFNSKPLLADPGESVERVILFWLYILFLSIVCVLIVFQLAELCIAMKRRRIVKLLLCSKFVISRLITCMAVLVIILFAYCEYLTRGLNQLTSDLPVVLESTRHNQLAFWQNVVGSHRTLQQYEQILDACVEQSVKIVDSFIELYWCVAIMAVCIIVQLLQALQAFRRCGCLLRCRTVYEVFNILVVSCILLSFFALVGNLLFGARIEHFSTFGLALETTFLVLQGNYDNSHQTKMRDEAGGFGVVWIWATQLLFAFAILYFVLAMLVGEYKAGRVDIIKHEQLREAIGRACAGSGCAKLDPSLSLSDSIRLCGRIDGNMWDLHDHMQRLQLALYDFMMETEPAAGDATHGSASSKGEHLCEHELSFTNEEKTMPEETGSHDTVESIKELAPAPILTEWELQKIWARLVELDSNDAKRCKSLEAKLCTLDLSLQSLITTTLTDAATDFSVGERVQRRDKGGTWGYGRVSQVHPLRVTLYDKPHEGGEPTYTWNEVRHVSEGIRKNRLDVLENEIDDMFINSAPLFGLLDDETAQLFGIEGHESANVAQPEPISECILCGVGIHVHGLPRLQQLEKLAAAIKQNKSSKFAASAWRTFSCTPVQSGACSELK